MGDDIEAIRTLKARYCRFLDTRQWEEFRELFTDDVTVDLGDAGMFDEAEGFLAFARSALEGTTSVHRVNMPEIEIVDADNATGIWAMADIVVRPGSSHSGYGHYHETYRRNDGEWRIASLRLTRLLVNGP